MFENTPATEVLSWAHKEHGEGLVVTASFADAVLLDLVSKAIPEADVVLLDTGYLFAETTWFANQLQERYQLRLQVLEPRSDTPVDGWLTNTEACCQARKVEPLERALAGRTAWVTGLRRAESPSRSSTPVVHEDLLRGVTKINPLATWGDNDMARYITEESLPEHPLADRGYPSIGCWPCTRPVNPGDDPRSGRWAGSNRTECGLHGEAVSTDTEFIQ